MTQTKGLSHVVTALAAILGAGVAALSALALVQTSLIPDWNAAPLPGLPLSEPLSLQAESATRAPQTPATQAAASRLTDAELARSPARMDAWERRVWLETQRGGGVVTPAAAAALRRSYAISRFDPDFWAWRTRYAFEHWGELDPALRELAKRELTVSWYARADTKVGDLPRTIVNPYGRMAALFATTAECKRCTFNAASDAIIAKRRVTTVAPLRPAPR